MPENRKKKRQRPHPRSSFISMMGWKGYSVDVQLRGGSLDAESGERDPTEADDRRRHDADEYPDFD